MSSKNRRNSIPEEEEDYVLYVIIINIKNLTSESSKTNEGVRCIIIRDLNNGNKRKYDKNRNTKYSEHERWKHKIHLICQKFHGKFLILNQPRAFE